MKFLIRLMEPFLTYVYLKVINYRGTSLMYELPEEKLTEEDISVVSVDGYKVGFFCQEVRYKMEYSKTSFTREFVVFRLYAKVDDTAPEDLRIVTKDTVHLPTIVPGFVSMKLQRRLLLEAYVDILKTRICNIYNIDKTTLQDMW